MDGWRKTEVSLGELDEKRSSFRRQGVFDTREFMQLVEHYSKFVKSSITRFKTSTQSIFPADLNLSSLTTLRLVNLLFSTDARKEEMVRSRSLWNKGKIKETHLSISNPRHQAHESLSSLDLARKTICSCPDFPRGGGVNVSSEATRS